MYSFVDDALPSPPAGTPITGEVGAILELRQRALESGELLYCSPVVRTLIEREIPHLVSLIARAGGSQTR